MKIKNEPGTPLTDEAKRAVEGLDILFAEQEDERSTISRIRGSVSTLNAERVTPEGEDAYVRVVVGSYDAKLYGEDIEWFAQLS